MTPVSVSYKRLHPAAQVPAPAHGYREDAGADLFSIEGVSIAPGATEMVSTGLAIDLPPGFEAQVRPRSGMAKRGVAAFFGTIDPGYRGELKVLLHNYRDCPAYISPGDRIAQIVVAPYSAVEWLEEAELTSSARGTGGFGSSGR